MSKAATQPLESELNKLETQIKRIQAAINVANQKIKSLEEDIFKSRDRVGLPAGSFSR